MQRTWERSVVVIAGAATAMWVAGTALYLGVGSLEVEHLGLVLIIGAATTTALGVLRSWHLRMRRAFVHGYHAGFHQGTGQFRPTNAKDCEVLELSEVKARRLLRLG